MCVFDWQVLNCQGLHTEVRAACVNYLRRNRSNYELVRPHEMHFTFIFIFCMHTLTSQAYDEGIKVNFFVFFCVVVYWRQFWEIPGELTGSSGNKWNKQNIVHSCRRSHPRALAWTQINFSFSLKHHFQFWLGCDCTDILLLKCKYFLTLAVFLSFFSYIPPSV